MSSRSSPLISFLASTLVFILALALYLSTLAPGMLRGDSGEFQWAMASLNVAHATGYPLFTLLGYGWLHLPISGAAAWRLNLLSPIFGALAVAVIFLLGRSIAKRDDAGLIGALFFALAPVFWFNASILEVYTLNAFFLALILFLLWKWSRTPTSLSWLYGAFFVLGLSLAHHRLMILAMPAIFIFILLTQPRLFINWRLLILLLLLIPGLLLYIYVPVRLLASGESLEFAINDVILGQEFAGSFMREWHPQVLWEIPWTNFRFGLLLGALGAVVTLRRWLNFAILLLLIYGSDVAFAFAYTVPDLPVFLTPGFVVIAVWITVGAAFLLELIVSRLHDRRQSFVTVAATAGLLVIALISLLQYDAIRAQIAAESGTAEERARRLLAADLPSGALLEIDWETATAIRFIQTTEKVRNDLEARLIQLNSRNEYLWVLRNADAGRAVYTERGVNLSRALAGYRTLPGPADLAQIVRIVPTAQAVDEKINDRVQLAAMSREADELVLYWKVLRAVERDLATYVHFFDVDGNRLGQQDRAPCCEAIFGYRTSEWEPGRVITDWFRPPPANTEYLTIGMYSIQNGDIEPYGRTLHFQMQPLQISPSAKPLDVRFENGITARAWALAQEGAQLKLTLYWGVQSAVSKDYTVSIQYQDASGKVLDDFAREPVDGAYPTTAWKSDQVIRDSYLILQRAEGAKLVVRLIDDQGKSLARGDGKGDSFEISAK